jgi:hypothetical protein
MTAAVRRAARSGTGGTQGGVRGAIKRVLSPDYLTLQINVGGLVGYSPQITIDKNLNVYSTVLGANVGQSATFVSGSLTLGWATLEPGAELRDFLSGLSINPAAGYLGGIGRSMNSSGSSWEAGLYSPQIGVGGGYGSYEGTILY